MKLLVGMNTTDALDAFDKIHADKIRFHRGEKCCSLIHIIKLIFVKMEMEMPKILDHPWMQLLFSTMK
jgi:hypothetical protein